MFALRQDARATNASYLGLQRGREHGLEKRDHTARAELGISWKEESFKGTGSPAADTDMSLPSPAGLEGSENSRWLITEQARYRSRR
ncbi:hypothetical protein KOW79_007777 [Hemibagrus wyckioides]|uniref:Uncharacterized protein n=1 Tax=Hemibagrus wyckioides TaxID=337641 RepID=A0A9D3NV38_9TELE|nr:hypothetical protein KOW79_007777 [Hemibagrus wyckioides]